MKSKQPEKRTLKSIVQDDPYLFKSTMMEVISRIIDELIDRKDEIPDDDHPHTLMAALVPSDQDGLDLPGILFALCMDDSILQSMTKKMKETGINDIVEDVLTGKDKPKDLHDLIQKLNKKGLKVANPPSNAASSGPVDVVNVNQGKTQKEVITEFMDNLLLAHSSGIGRMITDELANTVSSGIDIPSPTDIFPFPLFFGDKDIEDSFGADE